MVISIIKYQQFIKITIKTLIIKIMIKTFKNKDLEDFFYEGKARGISNSLVKRVRARLEAVDAGAIIDDIRLPGYGLHELKGNRKGTWSIKVSGNWRITFQFQDSDAYDVDIEDYH